MSLNNATSADAELILKLYDLRREAKMREARNWIANFSPQSADEVAAVVMQFGSQESAYFRQVLSYWETAAALVLHGALNESLFFDTQGEMWFVYGKLRPFITALREKFDSPEFMKNIETLANRTLEGQERVRDMEERMKHFQAMHVQQSAQAVHAKAS